MRFSGSTCSSARTSCLASSDLVASVCAALCVARSLATMSVASCPQFSDSVRATHSSASPNLVMAYWSSPVAEIGRAHV